MRCFIRGFIYLTTAGILLFGAIASAQSAGSDFKQSVTGGFLYGDPIGAYNQENSAPGYTINYAYQPLSWLAVEAGFNQVIHPVGTYINVSNGLQFPLNTNDQLYLVPFGARFIWQPGHGRGRVSVGAGGAYLNHHFNQLAVDNFFNNTSGIGGQGVVSGDYALSPSGRYRLGLTARFYYVNAAYKIFSYTYHENDRVFTIGTEFTFSFR